MFKKIGTSLLLAAFGAVSLSAQYDSGNCGRTGLDVTSDCSSLLEPDCGQSCGCDSGCCDAWTPSHYFSLFGGYVDIDNFERKLDDGNTTEIDGAKLHDDFVFGGSIGRQAHPHGRVEFEFTLRDNDVASWFEQEFDNSGVLTSNFSTAATGDLTSYSGMFNVVFDLYDRRVGCPGLYLGGGIGGIYVDSDFATATDSYAVADSSFAYQFIGGVNYAASQRVDLYAEYRYLGADYLNVDNLTTGQSLGDFTIDTNNVFVGVRVRR